MWENMWLTWQYNGICLTGFWIKMSCFSSVDVILSLCKESLNNDGQQFWEHQ